MSIVAVGFVLYAVDACVGPRVLPWELAPLPPDGVDRSLVADGPIVHVDRVRFHSASLGDTRYFLALVPNGPEPATRVAIVNHGWLDRPEDLPEHLAIERVYADLLAKTAVERAIIVLPDLRIASRFGPTKPRPPRSAVTTYVAEEVAALAGRLYGVEAGRSRWSVSGFSFGGLVALDVARTSAERFGSVGVVSGFYDHTWAFWNGTVAPADRGADDHATDSIGPPPRVMLACGTSDRFFREMQSLHQLFDASGIRNQWLIAPGGHTWQYWATVVEPLLIFHLGSGRSGVSRE